MRPTLATLTVRQLFLIDALGAVLTAVMLGVLLPALEPHFGMPRRVLVPLSAVALGFAVYSATCHRRAARARWMLVIATANALYCLGTLSLVLHFRASLTWLGVAYFLGEAVVILSLVVVEMRVALRELPRR